MTETEKRINDEIQSINYWVRGLEKVIDANMLRKRKLILKRIKLKEGVK